MMKAKVLNHLLEELNTQYNLSDDFRAKVSSLIRRLEELNLSPEQIEVLAGRVKETYERQVLVENYKEESRKSLEKMQSTIHAYCTALGSLNEKLQQAELALSNLLHNGRSNRDAGTPTAKKPAPVINRRVAKALAAFATIDSKNSRVN